MSWKAMKNSVNNIKVKDVLNTKQTYDIYKEGTTTSLLDLFLKCKRAFFFKTSGWVPVEKKKSYAFGTLVHDCLDFTYKKINRTPKAHSDKTIQYFINSYHKINKEWSLPLNAEEAELMKVKAFIVLTEYWKYYLNDLEFTDIVPEEIFDISWKQYRLRGKKDLLYSYKGARRIMETKTKSRIDLANIQLQLHNDNQSLMYYMVESTVNTVNLFVYNIIRNPGHKPKKAESIKEFGIRLRKEIVKYPEHFFIRLNTTYTAEDLKDFKFELYNKLEDMTNLLEGITQPYMNQSACVNPFKCEYLQACSSGCMNGYVCDGKLFKELEV